MSQYSNFVEDFPGRCYDLLDLAFNKAMECDREVTLLLMVATSGFTVPFERLRPHESDEQTPHPANDRQRFSHLASKLDELLDGKFWTSELWLDKQGSWKAGQLKSVAGEIDEWPELQDARKMSPDKTVKNVVKTIRNALAHGNIYTKGVLQDGTLEISEIVFVSENRNPNGHLNTKNPYRFVSVAPDDFLQFLLNWFGFLRKCHIQQAAALEALSRSSDTADEE